MTQDVNKFHISQVSGNIITAKGVIVSDKYLMNPPEGQKHQLEIVFAPGTDLTVLKNEMGKIAVEKLKGDANRAKQMVERRFLDPNNKPNGGKPLGDRFEGYTLVRASAQYAPDVILPNGKKCPPDQIQNELYRGRFGRATLNPFWTDNAENKGVFLGLTNIQLLDHGEPIGYVKPAGEEEFGAVDGVEGEAPASSGSAQSGGDVESLFG